MCGKGEQKVQNNRLPSIPHTHTQHTYSYPFVHTYPHKYSYNSISAYSTSVGSLKDYKKRWAVHHLPGCEGKYFFTIPLQNKNKTKHAKVVTSIPVVQIVVVLVVCNVFNLHGVTCLRLYVVCVCFLCNNSFISHGHKNKTYTQTHNYSRLTIYRCMQHEINITSQQQEERMKKIPWHIRIATLKEIPGNSEG